jgi:hypothetical protein
VEVTLSFPEAGDPVITCRLKEVPANQSTKRWIRYQHLVRSVRDVMKAGDLL